ncbi:TrbC/VirB2 family protein [Helicobacter cynogastricus]|uniref:TrbC/VirB2 family protein n=1 Tax=Helicobacter cynogastricus TaxID=329937 RepID=UPI002D78CBB9|nr:TrbC/VirB2 family protein [Helicobacter cynogastricus]
MFWGLGVCSLYAQGAEGFFSAIEAQLKSNTAKGILMLIFIGIAFYVWRNLDRWREIFFTILGVVLGIMLFFKAPALASWFMELF